MPLMEVCSRLFFPECSRKLRQIKFEPSRPLAQKFSALAAGIEVNRESSSRVLVESEKFESSACLDVRRAGQAPSYCACAGPRG